MLSQRNETHIRPKDPDSPLAELKTTDLVCRLYTVRWGSMQNVLANEVRPASRHASCNLTPGPSSAAAGQFCAGARAAALSVNNTACSSLTRGPSPVLPLVCALCPFRVQVNHQRVRCSHKCTGWSQQEGAEYITCHFKGQPDIK